jgi:hypothetical protein
MRAQLARVRQPRYFVAMLLGLLYLGWVFRLNTAQADAPFAELAGPGVAPTVVSALLLIMAARWWLARPDRGALAYSTAEVHLLFPAPISRRTLVHAKLLRGQLGILLNVLIWVLLLRGAGATIEGWQRGIGLWILFSTFSLHRLAAALVRLNASQHDSAGRRRSLVPALVFATMFVAVGAVLWQARPEITASWALGLRAALETTYDALQHPVSAIALAPVRALVTPAFAASGSAWLWSLPPALLVLALHYIWVVRSDTAFEEAALEASQERARRIAAHTGTQLSTKRSDKGKVARVFALPSWGHPAIAIAWKNAAAAIRGGGWVRQLVLVSGIFAISLLTLRLTVGMPIDVILALSIIWGSMLLLIGPVWMRYDLRLDLRDVATLRSLPLSSRSVVSASVMGVAALHTVSILAFLIVPVLFALADSAARADLLASLGSPIPAVTASVLVLYALNLLTFSVQNGLALTFPAWVQLGTDRRGFEAMGQTLLTVGITVITGAIALVFPVLIGVAMSFITRRAMGTWGLLVAAIIGTAVLLAELVPLWLAMGGALDETEPSDVPGQRT